MKVKGSNNMTTKSLQTGKDSIAKIVRSNMHSYVLVQKLLQAGQLLTIDFLGQNIEGKPYLHIKSGKNEFYYYIKQSSWDGIRRYLDEGVVEDFDPKPDDGLQPETGDFRFNMFKGFIEEGLSPVFIQPLRSFSEYLTFKLYFRHGSITFKFKRTDELVEQIAELDPDYGL